MFISQPNCRSRHPKKFGHKLVQEIPNTAILTVSVGELVVESVQAVELIVVFVEPTVDVATALLSRL